ncbi:MAG: 5-formyltetrahydrofolate cyclo-ligase [Lachnospiraceae bacterium]|nr:5-formyltetrahydrofolate cyclo-ligase [Lachnospiraceae bacterium]
MLVESKRDMRRRIVRLRDHQTESGMAELSEAICRRLFSIEMVAKAEDILLYADYGSEVRTGSIFARAKRMHKNIFYPRVEGDELCFYRVEDLSELQVGFHGIQEPFMQKHIAADFIYTAVAVVPGTVFSRDGYRIGYGKGFYDRFLARYPKVFKVGLAYEVQLVDTIPREAHDVRLNGLVTEEQALFW